MNKKTYVICKKKFISINYYQKWIPASTLVILNLLSTHHISSFNLVFCLWVIDLLSWGFASAHRRLYSFSCWRPTLVMAMNWKTEMICFYILILPVWVLVCLFKSKVSLKPFPQNVHKYLFMSEWHFICLFSRRWSANVLLQIRQAKLVCPSSVVIDATFVFSSVLELLLEVSWLAKGFLMPCPPFTNSSWTSAGRPNCNNNYKCNKLTWCHQVR